MSSKPSPLALTSATLARRIGPLSPDALVYQVAQLASAIHRLAPACKRLAEAQCNGEWNDGQRDLCHRYGQHDRTTIRERLDALEKSITDYATRLDRRIVKLNAQLAPFGYALVRLGDPRGATLRMLALPFDDSTTPYAIG